MYNGSLGVVMHVVKFDKWKWLFLSFFKYRPKLQKCLPLYPQAFVCTNSTLESVIFIGSVLMTAVYCIFLPSRGQWHYNFLLGLKVDLVDLFDWLLIFTNFIAWNSHNKAAILLNFDGLSSALDVPVLINIPYSIYYVFILAEELHYSNIKLHIKYTFHTKRIDVF